MTEEISNEKCKSTTDQDQACTQIPVRKDERKKLAFSTRDGKYQFTVLPYGLVVSGDLYCERKRRVLGYGGGDALMWRFIWSYVDDDCVASDSVIAHVYLLMLVFERFKRFGFTIRRAKCDFIKITVEYGGHLVGYKEIRPNPKKAAIVAKIQTPTSLKELRSFLQQASWVLRKFEPSFVDMAARLSSAFRKPNDRKPFAQVWNEDLQQAFDTIKASLAKNLVNATFDQDCPDTHLWFDWSKQATAAVLSQHGKIVRVWGRSCTVAESKYPSVKGEALAFKEAQVQFRPYLLSLKFFYAVTDHRPLLGVDAKADLSDLDPMHTKWRESTEMYRSRRKLLYVMGSRNLADFWSRLWPHKPLPQDSLELVPVCVAFSPEAGDFSLKEEDKKEVEMIQRNGIVFEDCRSHKRVYMHKSWRVYVPIRMRAPLILSLHLPRHVGDRRLKEKLSGYYFPKKKALVADFLRSCKCSPQKHDRDPRLESAESKRLSKITADKAMDIVQVDVYKHDGHCYLTAIDVHTSKAFVAKFAKVGSNARSRDYSRKLHNAYMRLESSMPRIPKKLVCDNEKALLTIPHPNIDPGPVLCAQHQAKVERLHGELAKLARIHKVDPEKAVVFYNADLRDVVSGSGGDGDYHAEPRATPVEPSKPPDAVKIPDVDSELRREDVGDAEPHRTSSRDQVHGDVSYDGRVLKAGDLVYQTVNRRSRSKSDPYWERVARVMFRVSDKSYMIDDGKKKTVHHIDNLKRFSLGESLIRNLCVSSELLVRGQENLGEIQKLDAKCKNFQTFEPIYDGKVVWLGYPGRAQLDRVASYVAALRHKAAYLVFPELTFESWYRTLNAIVDSVWYGVDPDDDIPFWVTHEGKRAMLPGVVWWVAKFRGKG